MGLLLNEYPLLLSPSLACKIGVKEALILQQLHYWLEKTEHIIRGKKWVYNSIENWQKTNFPFYSVATVKRAFESLKKKGLILVANFNRMKNDKTLWYSINYKALEKLEKPSVPTKTDQPVQSSEIDRKDEKMERSICTNGKVNLTQPLPETTTETNFTYTTTRDSYRDRDKDLNIGETYTLTQKDVKKRKYTTQFQSSRETNYISNRGVTGQCTCPHTKYTNEQLRAYISEKIPYFMIGKTDNDNRKKELVKIILYFYDKYQQYVGSPHRILSDKAYKQIIKQYLNPTGRLLQYNVYDLEMYKEMIDRYFKTKFGSKTRTRGPRIRINWELSHFMSGNIREYIFMHITHIV